MVAELSFSSAEENGKLAVVSLPKLLQAKCDVSFFFRQMLKEVIRRRGPHLELVMAWDEAVPGNVLSPDLSRKAGMTYGTIAHLPVPWANESWWSIAIARTHELQRCSLGYPSSMSTLLHYIVSETENGFTLVLDGTPHLCFFRNISLLADADGLRLLLGCKGSSGFKCCFQCINVITGEKTLAGHEKIHSTNVRTFRVQTAQNLTAVCEHLNSIDIKKQREEAEKLLGWHAAEMKASFLQNPFLQNVIQLPDVLYDPMHCWVANGIVGQEIGLWYIALVDTHTLTLAHLQDYVSRCWKNTNGNNWSLKKVLNPKKWVYGRDFRGDASETLEVLPLLVAFCIEVIDAAGQTMQRENQSLRALFDVIRTWSWYNMQQCHDPDMDMTAACDTLLAYQVKHLHLFKDCYGENLVRPKHHFSLHIGQQMQRKGWLKDCFPVERRHTWYKQYVAPMCKRLTCLPVSALLEMIHLDLNQEQIHSLEPCLHGRQHAMKPSAPVFPSGAMMARGLRARGLTYTHGDYFKLNDLQAFRVEGAVVAENKFFVLGQKLDAAGSSANRVVTKWFPPTLTQDIWVLPLERLASAKRTSYCRVEKCDSKEVVSLLLD
eukprot:s188_g5.t1